MTGAMAPRGFIHNMEASQRQYEYLANEGFDDLKRELGYVYNQAAFSHHDQATDTLQDHKRGCHLWHRILLYRSTNEADLS
jgi:hypothetical protein